MFKTTDLFAHTVYETEFPNYDSISNSVIDIVTKNFDKDFTNKYHGHEHPIRNGALVQLYNYKDKINEPEIQQLIDFISEHGKKYWKILNYSNRLDPYVLQMWATAVKQGGFVASHNHNPVPISGVFYAKASPEQGNLFLENPLDLVIGKSAYNSDKKTPIRFNHEVEASSGKLILFPGWMKHFTNPNPTQELRISLALNYGCTGQVYYTEYA